MKYEVGDILKIKDTNTHFIITGKIPAIGMDWYNVEWLEGGVKESYSSIKMDFFAEMVQKGRMG